MLRSFSYYQLRKRLSRICLGAPRAVIDGRMGPAEWIMPAGGGNPLKLDFDEHAFDRSDLSVFDPVIDLAGFSVEHRLPDNLEKILMIEYISRSGDTGAWERLPACKMIVCLSAQSELESQAFEGDADPVKVTLDLLELERVLSKTANGFLSDAFRLQEARWESDEMVAIDVDGVLEDSILGFSAMSPTAVKAVRTLARHGFQVVLATGRSLPDVIERSRILRVPGGIAEYGSVVWDRGREATATLVTPREMEQLRKLREILADQDGISIDPGHEYSVRVFQSAKGSRRRVAAFWLEQILRRWKLDEVRVIQGNSVTDVVGRSVNKGAGLLYLRRRFNAREVHAIGDTHEDAPLFRAADHSYSPANAAPGLVRGMRNGDLFVAKGKTQRGLFQIAMRIAHGRSRRCPLCSDADQWSEPVSILVEALSLRDRSRFQKISDLIGHDMLKNFYASL
ncbi:MAG: HAD family phosphatase [Ignavibacteria bacterium]|nr:MAG: HAD family phosphatase [Ignavibacteria bacterium]